MCIANLKTPQGSLELDMVHSVLDYNLENFVMKLVYAVAIRYCHLKCHVVSDCEHRLKAELKTKNFVKYPGL